VSGGQLKVAGAGSWTASRAVDLEPLVSLAAKSAAGAASVTIDMSAVREFDTYGAWLLVRLMRGPGGPFTRVEGLAENYQGLLDEAGHQPKPLAQASRA
jgi:phospholipid/cholesterol/gamma-HCH transport system permease protein